MYIIGDAGGTKTDWLVIRDNGDFFNVVGPGFNASTFSDKDLSEAIMFLWSSISDFLPLKVSEESVSLFVYCAGCNSSYASQRLIEAFLGLSPITIHQIEINSDLEGAARALFGNTPGIACILGTGSASGVFNGEKIIDSVPSLGYILGDEGSGAFMGKKLLNLYFKRSLSSHVAQSLEAFAGMTLSQTLERVYRSDNVASFLGSFVPYIKKNENFEEIDLLIDSSLKLFFETNVLKYNRSHIKKIGFVGGVALAFSQRLKVISSGYGFEVGSFISRPIDRLGMYHCKL